MTEAILVSLRDHYPKPNAANPAQRATPPTLLMMRAHMCASTILNTSVRKAEICRKVLCGEAICDKKSDNDSLYTAQCHGAQKSKPVHISLCKKYSSTGYHFYLSFSYHSLQAAKVFIFESNKVSPWRNMPYVCCESNHMPLPLVLISFPHPSIIWWYGFYFA